MSVLKRAIDTQYNLTFTFVFSSLIGSLARAVPFHGPPPPDPENIVIMAVAMAIMLPNVL